VLHGRRRADTALVDPPTDLTLHVRPQAIAFDRLKATAIKVEQARHLLLNIARAF
jgi:hypothetical protein